jgi:hypothetical protein
VICRVTTHTKLPSANSFTTIKATGVSSLTAITDPSIEMIMAIETYVQGLAADVGGDSVGLRCLSFWVLSNDVESLFEFRLSLQGFEELSPTPKVAVVFGTA